MGRTRRRNGEGERQNHFTGQDADLKQIARTDKRLAHERLYCRYKEHLYWHAIGIIKDAQAAEDIVQEVFIKASKERRLFSKTFLIKSWLYRVTSNACFNDRRNRNNRARILELQGDALIPEGKDLERGVYNQQVSGVMGKHMGELTEDHRHILTLRYWSDLTCVQIADLLGIKLGTVMSRLSRAREHLRLIAEADGYDAQTLDHAV